MTGKGNRNHYNIRILKGYGCSVKVKDSKIILKDCHDCFAEPVIEEWYVNKMPYEKIVISGKGYISTEALSLLLQYNRNVILVDTYGRPITFINPVMESLTATQYRIGQYNTLRNKSKREYLTKQTVMAKLESQINFLRGTNKQECYESICKLIEIQKQVKSKSNSIVLEKSAAKIYFNEFKNLIPERFEFESRNQSFIRGTKNNASDIINALLNYGYTVLAGEISKFINAIGLDAYYGFYHQVHTGLQPLVYDMIEPFRWLVDYSVWKLSIAHSNEQRITKKDYARTREGSVILDYNLIRRFLELLERTFQKERRYVFKHGKKTSDGLKNVQEITIAKIAVQRLADYCISKTSEFVI